MNFSIKPHQVVAHFVPGFILVCAIALPLAGWRATKLFEGGIWFAVTIAGFAAGEVIDAFRNRCLEGWFKEKVDWDFFFRTRDQRLANLDEFYYVYYLFDLNLLIAIVAGLIVNVTCFTIPGIGLPSAVVDTVHAWHVVVLVGAVLACIVLFADAKDLRGDLVRHTAGGKPHTGVRTRLGPSAVQGVGVFAICEIPEGAELFPYDVEKPRWINRAGLRGLSYEQVRLYDDFCLIEEHGRRLGCPRNFGLMGMSWYLNHSGEPNVRVDEDVCFVAARTIAEGEELTVDYRDYNDFGDDIPGYVGGRPLAT